MGGIKLLTGIDLKQNKQTKKTAPVGCVGLYLVGRSCTYLSYIKIHSNIIIIIIIMIIILNNNNNNNNFCNKTGMVGGREVMLPSGSGL